MNKNVIIGIDVGGSTTKIVGFDSTSCKPTLVDPIFVRATDPITSIYGAFGRFTEQNDYELADISRVMITGVGSSYVKRGIYSLPYEIVPEFRCTGKGGLYLSELKRAIVVSLGTGTALVYAEDGKEPQYLGGTGVGGGTLLGLSKKLLGMDNIEHIADLAETGDLNRVDLKINDITKQDIISGFSDVMTASNFGNISDIATKADIALGIINMVFETVGMLSVFAARKYGIRDVVLTGNLTTVKQAKRIFDNMNNMFDVNFMIPKNAQFGTVIGAARSGRD